MPHEALSSGNGDAKAYLDQALLMIDALEEDEDDPDGAALPEGAIGVAD